VQSAGYHCRNMRPVLSCVLSHREKAPFVCVCVCVRERETYFVDQIVFECSTFCEICY
jgi:hypothetical protein